MITFSYQYLMFIKFEPVNESSRDASSPNFSIAISPGRLKLNFALRLIIFNISGCSRRRSNDRGSLTRSLRMILLLAASFAAFRFAAAGDELDTEPAARLKCRKSRCMHRAAAALSLE